MFTLTYGSGGEERQELSKKSHSDYPCLQQLQSGTLFLNQINTAINTAEMMDVSDEDKRGWLCKHCVCTCVCVLVTKVLYHILIRLLWCGGGAISATITASKAVWDAQQEEQNDFGFIPLPL